MTTTLSVSELYLVALLIVFTLPYLVWRLGRTDDWAPLVVVQIVVGILLGPGVLGVAWPGAYRELLTPPVIAALNAVAQWSVMLFVFIAGIELDLGEAWRHRRESGLTAALALGAPLVCGALVAAGLLGYPGWIGGSGRPSQFVVGVGMACAVTALPILILFLEKMHLLREPLGQRILRYASLDDIAIWGVLALVLADWERVGRQLGFLVVLGIVCLAFRALMRRVPAEDRWYLAVVWLAACGLGADWSGLHYMVGAFLAGASLDAAWFDQRRMDSLRAHVLLWLMPVFFLSTGLRTNWEVGGGAVFAAAAVLLVASVAGKLLGVRVAGRLLGWRADEAKLIGWLLQTKALIMIIFANVLLDKRIITSATFTALLLMALASTMLTVPMTRPLLARLRRPAQDTERRAATPGAASRSAALR